MSAIVCSEKPCALSEENASSRFGPSVPVRLRVRERVARRARALARRREEQLLAVRDVALADASDRAAAGRGERDEEDGRYCEDAAQGYELVLGDAVEVRDRLVARRVDREDAVEAGDLEDLRDVPVAADERQLAVVRAQALDPADEDAERRRVDERRRREVDDHVLAALADHLEQLLLELGGRVEVDLAREGDHVGVVGDLLGLDVEVHRVPPVRLAADARESTSWPPASAP